MNVQCTKCQEIERPKRIDYSMKSVVVFTVLRMMPNSWYKCMITINVPVGFYGAVRNDLEAGNINYEGHFGPKWHSLRSLPFQGPKKSRFQGPPLIMAQVMDIARLKIIKSKHHKNYLCIYDLYSPVHNVLHACISITRGSGRGLGPGILEFFGPCEMVTSR
jgi:hypothetical protein